MYTDFKDFRIKLFNKILGYFLNYLKTKWTKCEQTNSDIVVDIQNPNFRKT